MDVTTTLLEHDHWLVGELLERAGRLSDEQLDRPIEANIDILDSGVTLRLLLHRLVSTKERWTAAVEGRRPPGGTGTRWRDRSFCVWRTASGNMARKA